MDDLPSSISFDKRPYAQDIQGSMVHAKMLYTQRLITAADERAIQEGLAGNARGQSGISRRERG